MQLQNLWGALWPAGGCRVRDNTARRREGAPADFRRQCRARPPPRARATRPRLFRTVGKAIGAEGVGASGAGGRTQSPRGSSPRAPSGSVPQDGARRRLSAPAQPRVLKLPGTPDSAREPTDPGARAGEVRRRRTGAKKTAAGFRSFQPLINLQSKSSEPSSLPSCSGDQAAAAPELSPYCPPATSSGIPGSFRPRGGRGPPPGPPAPAGLLPSSAWASTSTATLWLCTPRPLPPRAGRGPAPGRREPLGANPAPRPRPPAGRAEASRDGPCKPLNPRENQKQALVALQAPGGARIDSGPAGEPRGADFIYSFMRDTERGRDIGRGRSWLPTGTPTRDSRSMT
ncbi:uncharacterized protein LOC144304685 [Canis aureus]